MTIKYNDKKVTAKTLAMKLIFNQLLTVEGYWKEDIMVNIDDMSDKEILNIQYALEKEISIFLKKHENRIQD